MKKLLIITILLCLVNTLYSQGFIWNEEIEQEFIQTVPELEVTRSVFPSSWSLEKYLPSRQYQGKTQMCLAYAVSVGRTVLFAKNNNLTDIEEIDKNIFSPFFLYFISNGVGSDVYKEPLNPNIVLRNAHKKGIAKMQDVEFPDYYPYTEQRLNGSKYPENKKDLINDFSNAYHHIIDSYHYIINTNGIKSEISSNNPVIFGFSVVPLSLQVPQTCNSNSEWFPEKYSYPCLSNLKDNKWLKTCQEEPSHETGFCNKHTDSLTKETIGHAMLIVGYNDSINGGSFLILNSWGNKEKDWAEKGKIWIRYTDFWKYAWRGAGKTPFVVTITKSKEISKLGMRLNSSNISIPSHLIKESFGNKLIAEKNIPYSFEFEVKERKD